MQALREGFHSFPMGMTSALLRFLVVPRLVLKVYNVGLFHG